MEEIKLTAKQAATLEILKGNGGFMFPADIAAERPDLFEKGSKSVSPLMNHLVVKGYVAKDKADCQVVDKEGKEVVKTYTCYQITPAGAELVYSIKE